MTGSKGSKTSKNQDYQYPDMANQHGNGLSKMSTTKVEKYGVTTGKVPVNNLLATDFLLMKIKTKPGDHQPSKNCSCVFHVFFISQVGG